MISSQLRLTKIVYTAFLCLDSLCVPFTEPFVVLMRSMVCDDVSNRITLMCMLEKHAFLRHTILRWYMVNQKAFDWHVKNGFANRMSVCGWTKKRTTPVAATATEFNTMRFYLTCQMRVFVNKIGNGKLSQDIFVENISHRHRLWWEKE